MNPNVPSATCIQHRERSVYFVFPTTHVSLEELAVWRVFLLLIRHTLSNSTHSVSSLPSLPSLPSLSLSLLFFRTPTTSYSFSFSHKEANKEENEKRGGVSLFRTAFPSSSLYSLSLSLSLLLALRHQSLWRFFSSFFFFLHFRFVFFFFLFPRA